MNCDEFENRILDYQENQLSAGEREVMESHLAGCANCQPVARRLERLNVALSSQLKAPVLPANFEARLMQRIQTETVALSESERVERKRQIQLEYASGQARLRRPHFAFVNWTTVLGYPVTAAVAGLVIWRFTPALTNFLSASGAGSLGQSLVLLLGSGFFVFTVLTGILARGRIRNYFGNHSFL